MKALQAKIATLEEAGRRTGEASDWLAKCLYKIAEAPYGPHIDDAPAEKSANARTAKVAVATVGALVAKYEKLQACVVGAAPDGLLDHGISELAAKVEDNADVLRAQLKAACADVRDLCAAIAPGDFRGSPADHVERAKQTREALRAAGDTSFEFEFALAEGNMLPD